MQLDRRLVVVSNRVPDINVAATDEERRTQSASGVVSALRPVLEEMGGIWFGWNGRAVGREASKVPAQVRVGAIELVTLGLSKDEVALFYTVFANQSLWPLLHNFPARAVIRGDAYRVYRRVNRRFAAALLPLLREGDLIWVHDYHLLTFGHELRSLGWDGKIGFFLHTPFPSVDVFSILPWSRQLLEALMSYDLVGFHTQRYARNLLACLHDEFGGAVTDSVFTYGEESVRVGVYPVGTDPASFERWAAAESGAGAGERLPSRKTRGQGIVLGVDRLDYTKGIPRRLLAFERLLEHNPSLRGKVRMVQISVPSRTRVPEYVEEKVRVDQIVGRITGRFSDASWAPIQHLYRSYSQQELAHFYREAAVGLVTPLSDGMNLVAKEFIAAQGDDPGVLVLSKFTGAAESMREALIVNPYDIQGTAEAIHRALMMPRSERRRRCEALRREVRTHTAQSWRSAFIADLANGA